MNVDLKRCLHMGCGESLRCRLRFARHLRTASSVEAATDLTTAARQTSAARSAVRCKS
jgi:hypothetical protein